MKTGYYILCSLLIVGLAIFLRFQNFAARAPFDWDQNRDYLAVSKIASGNFTLVGPVAKGDGGFLLGPLYYYLVTPIYVITNGSPYSLPITSTLIDLLSIIAVLLFLVNYLGRPTTLLAAFLLSASFVGVESAIVSWNVSLVPLYVVLFLNLLISSHINQRLRLLLLGLVTGLAWHVHAALIPLTILLVVAHTIITRLKLGNLLIIGLGYILAISPLIIFDIRHVGLERHLIAAFLEAHNSVKPPWSDVIFSALSRFGKNIYAFAIGTSDLHLWWGIGATILASLSLFRKDVFVTMLSLSTLFNLILVVLLRESGFPEYYLQFATISIILLVLSFFKKYLNKYWILALMLGFIYVAVQLPAYRARPKSFAFSLQNKIALAQKISSFNQPTQLHNNLPYGRDSGIATLINKYGTQLVEDSNLDILLTESHDPTLFIDGEIAEDLGYFGGFRLAIRGVQ